MRNGKRRRFFYNNEEGNNKKRKFNITKEAEEESPSSHQVNDWIRTNDDNQNQEIAAMDPIHKINKQENNNYRLVIVGERGYNNWNEFQAIMDEFEKDHGLPKTIVSGGPHEVDSLGARWAKLHGLELIEFIPEWKKYGKSAGIIRNTDVIKRADVVLALPTSESRGTRDSVHKAQSLNKILVIHQV